MKVMFSIHVGDSIAHILRTRGVAKRMLAAGHSILYLVPRHVHSYLVGYVPHECLVDDSQNYGFSRRESFDTLAVKFCEKSASEYKVYKSFNPDVVIGDMGLTASVYCIETPLIKILNRFPLELDRGDTSALSGRQRQYIVSQLELLINRARSALGIKKSFSFSDFLSTPTILHGAKCIVEYSMPNMVAVGFRSGIRLPDNFKPDPSNVFLSLGTGVSPNKETVARRILQIIESKCDKIYIGVGARESLAQLPFPKRAIVKSMFEEYPPDAGRLICHGGYGIIHIGLLASVRIDAFPFHVEHFCNAERMVALCGGNNYGSLTVGEFQGLEHEINYDYERFQANYEKVHDAGFLSPLIELCSDGDLCHAIFSTMERYR